MDISCNYSFWDLYKSSHKTDATEEFKAKFFKLTQGEINKKVISWAKRAGWQTERRIGSDNKVYIAFYPADPGVRSAPSDDRTRAKSTSLENTK